MLSGLAELAADSAQERAFAESHGAVDQMPIRLTDVDGAGDVLAPAATHSEQPRIEHSGVQRRGVSRLLASRNRALPELDEPPPKDPRARPAAGLDGDATPEQPPAPHAEPSGAAAPAATAQTPPRSSPQVGAPQSAKQRNYGPTFGVLLAALMVLGGFIAWNARTPPAATADPARQTVIDTLVAQQTRDALPAVAMPTPPAATPVPPAASGEQRYAQMLADIKNNNVLGRTPPTEPAALPAPVVPEVVRGTRSAPPVPAAAAPAAPTKRIGLLVEGMQTEREPPAPRDPIPASALASNLAAPNQAPSHNVPRIEQVDGEWLAYVVRRGQRTGSGQWAGAGDVLPDGWRVASVTGTHVTLVAPDGAVLMAARRIEP